MTPHRVTYTPAEVAEQLKVRVKRIYELRRRGELAGFNVGTPRRPEWRFTETEIDRFLARRQS